MPDRPLIRTRHSLSAVLLGLTLILVVMTEAMAFLPGLAREEVNWLENRVALATLATLPIAADEQRPIEPAVRSAILHTAGAVQIRLRAPGRNDIVLDERTDEPGVEEDSIDLRQEDAFNAVLHALTALVPRSDTFLQITAPQGVNPDGLIQVVIRHASLDEALWTYTRSFLWLALGIALVTGSFVYCAVLLLLVRPIRRLTDSIIAFRTDPERATLLDPTKVTMLPAGEIGVAGHELAILQRELRAALWRNARLAALGTVLAKVGHDLRNIISPALLTAERLQMHADPSVQRAGTILVRTVDRATELISRTLAFAREGPQPLTVVPVNLAALIDEVAEGMGADEPCQVVNLLGPTDLVNGDREQLMRVMSNLFRNASESGARHVRVTPAAQQGDDVVVFDVSDDGPGLPAGMQERLFRPFSGTAKSGGSGLGLAIVRDLTRAHGGDITLAETGPHGTVFRLTLPAATAQFPGRTEGTRG